MTKKIRVGITQGDCNGVGPEIILKSLAHPSVTDLFTPVVFADWRVMEQAAAIPGIEAPQMHRVAGAAAAADGKINIVDLRLDRLKVTPGRPTPESGAGAVAALEAAMTALGLGEIDVLVTAPISKEAVQSDAFRFPGHTEYLASKAGEGHKAQMILFDDHVRVALVTTHLPLADIPQAITRERVAGAVKNFNRTLREDFGIERPKIAVLSLNPHCGDGGLLGTEEKEVITPAIDDCIADGILAFGPFAADGFFGTGAYTGFDGVLAMYHDQGLGAFKALARQNGVNFTAGLPFVRTSPDHGTAFDIAWSGTADPVSMREAIYKAVDIFRTRERYRQASANPLRHQAAERHPKTDKGNRRPARQDEESRPEKESDAPDS